MEISLSQLVKQKGELRAGISEKFHISLNGAEEFVKLAIIEWSKTNYNIKISEQTLNGPVEILQKLEEEVLSWTVDDFDEEDFQVISYCKNIR